MVNDPYREVIDLLNSGDRLDQPVRRKHRLPLDSYSASDCEFFFTLCARQHGRPFADPNLAAAIIDALLWRKERYGWTLYCYCLMPDHLHFLVRLAPGVRSADNPGNVLDQIAQFKSYTTSQVWWKRSGKGPLWQKSSYDEVIRYLDSPESAARYVVNNPVRKGLVQHWEEYPYAKMVDPW